MTRKSAAGMLVLLVTSGMGAGCAPAARSANAADGDERVTVRVENHNWADVNVFAIRGGMRVRLGTVTTASTERFRLPSSFTMASNDLVLVADPIGSRFSYTSPPIMVMPGEQILWRVENNMNHSSLRVVRR